MDAMRQMYKKAHYGTIVFASDSAAIFDMQAANFSIEDCFVPRKDA
jgi:hypothetical protein